MSFNLLLMVQRVVVERRLCPAFPHEHRVGASEEHGGTVGLVVRKAVVLPRDQAPVAELGVLLDRLVVDTGLG
jgi:hypothetical protein